MARPANYDKKIARLIADLRKALVARETAKIEATVASQVDALVAALSKGGSGVSNVVATPAAAPAPASPAPTKPTKKKRRGWSASAKAAAKARMKAWWASKRKGGKKQASASQ